MLLKTLMALHIYQQSFAFLICTNNVLVQKNYKYKPNHQVISAVLLQGITFHMKQIALLQSILFLL